MTHTLSRCVPKVTQTCKSYDRIKPELDKAKKEKVDDALVEGKDTGKQERNIEIIRGMLGKNMDVNLISDLTDTCLEDIEEIKKEMGL